MLNVTWLNKTCNLTSSDHVIWWDSGNTIEVDPTYESAFLTMYVDGFLNNTLGLLLQSYSCMAFAVLLIVQYHIRRYLAGVECVKRINEQLGVPSVSVKRIGMNLLILQFYLGPLRYVRTEMEYVLVSDESTKKPRCVLTNVHAFVFTMALIFVDTLLHAIFLTISKLFAPPFRQALDKVKTPMEQDTEDGHDAAASNIYMDMTCPFSQSLMIMIVQIGLIYLYILHFWSDDKTHNSDPVSRIPPTFRYLYWILGVLIQLFAGDIAMGKPVNVEWWRHLLGLSDTGCIARLFQKFDDADEDDTMKAEVSGRKHYLKRISHHGCVKRIGVQQNHIWFLRFLMDWSVNGIGRTLILFTFPIMLSVEEALDFVKDCMAVFFITQLDDVRDKDWTELMVRIKFNMSYESGQPVQLDSHEAKSVLDEKKKKYGDKYFRQRQHAMVDGEEGLLELMIPDYYKKTA